MARWEGANSNTFPHVFEVTASLIRSLIHLAYSLRRLYAEISEGNMDIN